jgi:hypothetical protein
MKESFWFVDMEKPKQKMSAELSLSGTGSCIGAESIRAPHFKRTVKSHKIYLKLQIQSLKVQLILQISYLRS